MWDYNKYIDPSYKNYSRTRRRISPARLFKILCDSDHITNNEMIWIFQQCYEVGKREATEMFSNELEKAAKARKR